MRITSSAVALLFGGLFSFLGSVQASEPPPGFTALWNGRDLSGWRGGATYDPRALAALPETERAALLAKWGAAFTGDSAGNSHWRVVDGELVSDGDGSFATTTRDYGDLELLLEYKLTSGADSGVYLRGVPQIQLWDHTAPDPKNHGRAQGSGGLWNNPPGAPGRDPLKPADRPVGAWNRLRVLMLGSRVSVWLNDEAVVDHAILQNAFDRELPPAERRPVPSHGPIQLQTHGGATHWRNLFIREIDADDANRLLASRGAENFTAIFNGKSLDGWAGATKAVDIVDDALVWKKGEGGVLYWNETLADFQARLFFKLPRAGNNGLAIRYPGRGGAAYDGMCELQVLDENYEEAKNTKLDPRQYHGSAYGMVSAKQGYQRPIGTWNFQQVTVRGSRLQVELNGTIILDTDLAEVDLATVMANKPHPGVGRTQGYFGFAGHTDPVAFKAIAIRKL